MRLENWSKRKEYLLCVDSDGCAMDTMNCKHFYCFGPCMIREWNLEPWEAPIQKRWNEINLYSMTRGINRFRGLAIALTEINEKYRKIDGLADLVTWVDQTDELSNRSLEKEVNSTHSLCLKKALAWSWSVNHAIEQLPESMKKPFPGVAKALAAAKQDADIVVVSSANRDAVEREWNHWKLMEYVDVLCCQDSGSKAFCIAALKEKGYDPDRMVMAGDAPGDLKAAQKNGVHFYPILVNHEAESWKELCDTGLQKLISGNFAEYEEKKKELFIANLTGVPQ